MTSDATGWKVERWRVEHDPVAELEYARSVGIRMREDDVAF